ncbi:uncharacterized protein DSM5745_09709 [Aspergillus mulundensis]|uniref:Uncharacterized protein n=1 Tax=Aspergillus mulundensis TaxID=1810919 RepID=A0A3D8QRK6_9EURO|nr:hypothetical protein DSM5745_09709 [Aspergillus mulundensis]RDW64298.1 hypothetical protein DSM5745_09709 [Aspergillus mulundensis]
MTYPAIGEYKKGSRSQITRRSEEERIRQKQAALRGTDAQKPAYPGAVTAEEGGSGLIKGLKKIKTPEPEKPYDPEPGVRNRGQNRIRPARRLR